MTAQLSHVQVHEEAVTATRAFVDEQVVEWAGAMARGHGPSPQEVVLAAGKYGIAGLLIPHEFGGRDVGIATFVDCIEMIAAACASTAVILDVHISVAIHCLVTRGSRDLQERYLPKLAAGEWTGAFALTEPGSGSDAAAARTSATAQGDTYSLSGEKMFITNGGAAHTYVVIARTGGLGAKGLSAFIVEGSDEGCVPGEPLPKLGLHGSRTTPLTLRDVSIPAWRRVGDEGVGFRIAMEALDVGRIGIAAQATGVARGALAEAARSLAPTDLATLTAATEAARALTRRASHAATQGSPAATRLAASAKLCATDTAMAVASACLESVGEEGMMANHPLAIRFADAKACQIYEGTNQIQRIVVARELYGATSRS